MSNVQLKVKFAQYAFRASIYLVKRVNHVALDVKIAIKMELVHNAIQDSLFYQTDSVINVCLAVVNAMLLHLMYAKLVVCQELIYPQIKNVYPVLLRAKVVIH